MEKNKSNGIVDQAAILLVAMLLSRVLGFLMRVPLTHFIGDAGNAYYSAAFQVYTFLLVLSSAGLPAAISKLVSERITLKRYHDAHAVYNVSLFISAVSGVVGAVAILFGARLIADLINQPLSYYSMIALAPTVLIVGIMAVLRGYFQGMSTTKPTAISQIIEQVFNVAFSILFAWALHSRGPEYGAAGGAAGTGIGAIAGLAVMLIIYSLNSGFLKKRLKNARIPQQESYAEIASAVFKTAWPIILGTAVFSIMGLIDMATISNLLVSSDAFTREEVDIMFGQYNGKYIVLTTMPIAISAALATAVIPSIAASKALNDEATVTAKVNLALRLAMLLTIPAAIGLSVLGDPIVRMLFPTEPEGGYLLQWGGMAVVFLALYQMATGILQGLGYVKLPVIGAAAAAVVKISLNYVLISNPEINILGAVFSTVACYSVAALLNTILLKRVTQIKIDFVSILVKPLICAVGMGIASFGVYEAVFLLTQSNAIGVILAITFGASVYFLGMVLIKGIERSDLEQIPMSGKLIRAMDRLGM